MPVRSREEADSGDELRPRSRRRVGGHGMELVTVTQMACHTWALSGNPERAREVHLQYEGLSNRLGMHYGYGSNLRGRTLMQVRQSVMESISELCDERTERTGNRVFLCGGFRNGQVCPEHVWLEDHTASRTYDTFIDQPVRYRRSVGVENQPFRPGCEREAFAANEIARVLMQGYTSGQVRSLPRG